MIALSSRATTSYSRSGLAQAPFLKREASCSIATILETLTDTPGAARTSGTKAHAAGATEMTSARMADGTSSAGSSIFREDQTVRWCAIEDDPTN